MARKKYDWEPFCDCSTCVNCAAMNTEKEKTMIQLVVPMVPPSVNHYKAPSVRFAKGKPFIHWYVTPEGAAYKRMVALIARGQKIKAKEYELLAVVYLGKGQRGDGDNFWKVIGDGLVDAGVIHSDAAVKLWTMRVERDPKNPRTEIFISVS